MRVRAYTNNREQTTYILQLHTRAHTHNASHHLLLFRNKQHTLFNSHTHTHNPSQYLNLFRLFFFLSFLALFVIRFGDFFKESLRLQFDPPLDTVGSLLSMTQICAVVKGLKDSPRASVIKYVITFVLEE